MVDAYGRRGKKENVQNQEGKLPKVVDEERLVNLTLSTWTSSAGVRGGTRERDGMKKPRG